MKAPLLASHAEERTVKVADQESAVEGVMPVSGYHRTMRKSPQDCTAGLPSTCRIVTHCRASMRQDGPGRARRGIKKFVGNRPPSLPSSVLKNAKRPPCGGPRILFPRPAGTGHGHRNYSALSALAGASVLASGRRVSSMMAMGALSPLRGMASFITRV